MLVAGIIDASSVKALVQDKHTSSIESIGGKEPEELQFVIKGKVLGERRGCCSSKHLLCGHPCRHLCLSVGTIHGVRSEHLQLTCW